MDNKKDPLTALISDDTKSVDRLRLAELLKPFLIIDQESKGFAFLPAFEELANNADKLEIILAGSKARALLFSIPDGMNQSELIELAVIAEGSVKSTLNRLSDKHKLKKDKEGRYSVPGHRISELTKKFSS